MFMAASAALCFASFLLVPSPEIRLKRKLGYAVKIQSFHNTDDGAIVCVYPMLINIYMLIELYPMEKNQ